MANTTYAVKQAEKALAEALAEYKHAVTRVQEEAKGSLDRFERWSNSTANAKKGSGYVDSFNLNLGNMAADVARAAGKAAMAEQALRLVQDLVEDKE